MSFRLTAARTAFGAAFHASHLFFSLYTTVLSWRAHCRGFCAAHTAKSRLCFNVHHFGRLRRSIASEIDDESANASEVRGKGEDVLE